MQFHTAPQIKNMNDEYLICQCSSPEHTIHFIFDKDENEIYTEIFLNQSRSFLKRIWIAIKYIFGYKSKYGHWDTFLMRNEDILKIKRLLEDNQ